MTLPEARLRQIGGILLITFFSVSIGYVAACGYAQYRFGLDHLDLLYVARNYAAIKATDHRT